MQLGSFTGIDVMAEQAAIWGAKLLNPELIALDVVELLYNNSTMIYDAFHQ